MVSRRDAGHELRFPTVSVRILPLQNNAKSAAAVYHDAFTNAEERRKTW